MEKPLNGKKINKLLEIIERIVDDDFAEDMDFRLFKKRDFTQKEAREMVKRMCKVYKIAHAFNTSNICYNVHSNWRENIKL